MRSLPGLRVMTPPEAAGRVGVAARLAAVVAAIVIAAACAAKAPPAPVAPLKPSYEQKMIAILRFEDRRTLSDTTLPPPTPSDLTALLTDEEGRVRRRAALAAGRVGLSAAVAPV